MEHCVATVPLSKYDVIVPRYTSYPPASAWGPMGPTMFSTALSSVDRARSHALYLHIPFCRSLCLYCGCFTIPNHIPDREERYIHALADEMALVARTTGPLSIHQVHFGGGSPSKLSGDQLTFLMRALRASFSISQDSELAIEIDPRTVSSDTLALMRELGFNRISLGVQDLDQGVQEAVARLQPKALVTSTFDAARQAGFRSINIDLIYGLPKQTRDSFAATIREVCALGPDRLSLFSFAYMPEHKPHQRAIPAHLLPGPEEKSAIYLHARELLVAAGYQPVGLDHFARPDDPLVSGTIVRNFQGYCPATGGETIGLGLTAISTIGKAFFQNTKSLETYYAALSRTTLATERGKIPSLDDLRHGWVIEQLMCYHQVSMEQFSSVWDVPFLKYFSESMEQLRELIEDHIVVVDGEWIRATTEGRLLIRNVARCFDTYPSTTGSRSI